MPFTLGVCYLQFYCQKSAQDDGKVYFKFNSKSFSHWAQHMHPQSLRNHTNSFHNFEIQAAPPSTTTECISHLSISLSVSIPYTWIYVSSLETMAHTFCQSQSRREIRKGKLAHLNNLHVIFCFNLLAANVKALAQLYGPSNCNNKTKFLSLNKNLKFQYLGFLRLENSNVAHAVKSIRPFDVKVTRSEEKNRNPFVGCPSCARLFQYFVSLGFGLQLISGERGESKRFTLKFSMQNTNISYVNSEYRFCSWLHVFVIFTRLWTLWALSTCVSMPRHQIHPYANASIGMTECDTCNDVRFCANGHINFHTVAWRWWCGCGSDVPIIIIAYCI